MSRKHCTWGPVTLLLVEPLAEGDPVDAAAAGGPPRTMGLTAGGLMLGLAWRTQGEKLSD